MLSEKGFRYPVDGSSYAHWYSIWCSSFSKWWRLYLFRYHAPSTSPNTTSPLVHEVTPDFSSLPTFQSQRKLWLQRVSISRWRIFLPAGLFELKGANESLEVIQFDRKNCLLFRLVHVKLLHCVVAATSEGRSLRQLTVAIMSLRQVRKEVQSISQLRS